jgi:phytoene synthase
MEDEDAAARRDAEGAASGLPLAYAHCESLLREHDKDRFLADLFLPAKVRPHAQALQAFSFEIARVREVVSEPMPGELRHQWWRDALIGEVRGDASANPVAAALLDTLERFHLPSAALEALIDARSFDLYDDPMPDFPTLEAYCRDTSSVLFRLVAEMLDAASGETRGAPSPIAAAAEPAGITYAYTGLIRAFALHAAQRRLYLPSEVLRRHGALPEDILSGRFSPSLLAAIGDWRGEARRHLAAAKAAIAALPAALRPAFLPLALVEPYLQRTQARDYDPFRTPVELPQWRRQWILWRGL